MKGQLSDEAIRLADVLRRQIRRAGGVDLLRRSVADPVAREVAEQVLNGAGLGIWIRSRIRPSWRPRLRLARSRESSPCHTR